MANPGPGKGKRNVTGGPPAKKTKVTSSLINVTEQVQAALAAAHANANGNANESDSQQVHDTTLMGDEAFADELDLDLFDPDISGQAICLEDQPSGASENIVDGATFRHLAPSMLVGQSDYHGKFINLAAARQKPYEAPVAEHPPQKYCLDETIPLFFYRQHKSFKKNGTTVRYQTCVLEKSYVNRQTNKEGRITVDVPLKCVQLLGDAVNKVMAEAPELFTLVDEL